jgi:hypothetical protein
MNLVNIGRAERRCVLARAVTLLLISTNLTVSAQTDWAAARGIRQGGRVRVITQSGERVTGDVVTVTSDLLVVDVGGSETRLPQSEVRRLYTVHRVKPAAVKGLLIGGAAGVSVALMTAETDRGPWAVMLGAGWGVIGALIGSVAGLQARERLVYAAATP